MLDTVYFGSLRSQDGSVQHTGDNLTGAGDGDDESIIVDLPTIRPHKLAMHTMQQQTLVIIRLRCSDGVEGIGRVTFKDVDVVRHDLVRRIVTAYEKASHGQSDADRNPNPRRRPLA